VRGDNKPLGGSEFQVRVTVSPWGPGYQVRGNSKPLGFRVSSTGNNKPWVSEL
jgi:hypothetical protein